MKNIIENNKLIADFLVNNEGNLVKIRDGVYSTIDENEVPDDNLTINDLKYHEDWNWLMVVVRKCREFSNEEDSHWENIYYALTDLDIYRVYMACVQFIKWYNEQNKTNESL